MDLALDLTRSSGRAAKPVRAEIVRALTAADLALLETERGIKPSPIKRLRDAHHSIARCVAQGMSGAEIQLITGYSQSRISILKSDPAFQELCEFYRQNLKDITDQIFADGQTKLNAVNQLALDILHDRLEEEPEVFSPDQILDVVVKTADRTGNGPASKSTSVNVNIDLADRIAAGRQRIAKLSPAAPPAAETSGPVLDLVPVPTGEKKE